MGIWEALKAAIIAIPGLLQEWKAIREHLAVIAKAAQDARAMELRNEQRFAAIQTLKLQVDQDRAEMVRRLSELERRPR